MPHHMITTVFMPRHRELMQARIIRVQHAPVVIIGFQVFIYAHEVKRSHTHSKSSHPSFLLLIHVFHQHNHFSPVHAFTSFFAHHIVHTSCSILKKYKHIIQAVHTSCASLNITCIHTSKGGGAVYHHRRAHVQHGCVLALAHSLSRALSLSLSLSLSFPLSLSLSLSLALSISRSLSFLSQTVTGRATRDPN